MKQLRISCVKQIFEYATPVWYQKLTDQWKDKIQKVQNTALHKNLGAFKSTPAKPMKFDSEALPANIRKKTCDKFAIWATRSVSPKNRNSLTALIQERVTLNWFLIESSK